MTVYRCCLWSRTGVRKGVRTIRSETDAGARRLALELLSKNPEIRNLEAWRSGDLVFRVSRLHLLHDTAD